MVKGGRSGRRILGGIFELSNGKEMFLSFQKRADIYRAGQKCVSEARDKGVACWGVSYDTLLEMRREQVLLIGVYCRCDDEIYLTNYDAFFDEDKATVRNYEQRGSVLMKYLPLQHFIKTTNEIPDQPTSNPL